MQNRIRELRKQKGISQKGLAIALNLSQQEISNYENGVRNPGFKTLHKLVDYFGVSVEYLLSLDDDNAKTKCKCCTFDEDGYGANIAGDYKDCEIRLCEVGENEFKIYAFAPASDPLIKNWVEFYSIEVTHCPRCGRRSANDRRTKVQYR